MARTEMNDLRQFATMTDQSVVQIKKREYVERGDGETVLASVTTMAGHCVPARFVSHITWG